MPQQKNQRAFSLIELLVVISVLAVLVALLLPNLVGIRVRARDAARKHDLVQLKNSLRMYYNDFQVYPDNASNSIVGCGASGTSVCPNPDGSFAAGDVVYMRSLPDFVAESISYTRVDAGDDFLLAVPLENASDPDIAVAAVKCGQSATGNTYFLCAD